MNWKQFLKPDRKKIIVFFVFVFIILLYLLFGPIFPIVGDVLLSIPLFSLMCPVFGSSNSIFCLIQNILVIIIIPLYWYLLSCLIVWLYDKVRKKE